MTPTKGLLAYQADRMFDFVTGMLSQSGRDVSTTTGGVECLAKLREHMPDLIVMGPELRWGGYDGALARMRQAVDRRAFRSRAHLASRP